MFGSCLGVMFFTFLSISYNCINPPNGKIRNDKRHKRQAKEKEKRG